MTRPHLRGAAANAAKAISPYPLPHHNLQIRPHHLQLKKTRKLHSSSSAITPIVLVHSPSLETNIKEMAAMNSTVLSCNYALSGASETNWKLACAPSVAPVSSAGPKLPAIRAQQGQNVNMKEGKAAEGRRAALLGLAAAVFATAASQANAGILDEYLEKSQANKELNDKKRLATINANFARAYTVQFGTCKFPENFTGCQDLAKQKKVPFLSDDLDVECEGKDKYKCGSNVFWKW